MFLIVTCKDNNFGWAGKGINLKTDIHTYRQRSATTAADLQLYFGFDLNG